MGRFVINALLVIGIPLLLIYGAFALNIIYYRFVEVGIWIIAIATFLFLGYVNSIIETFFLSYRYTAYKKITQK